MGHSKPTREDRLLDFHLHQLSEEERTKLEAELLRDVELRNRSDRLRQLLRPLDHWTVRKSHPVSLIGCWSVQEGVPERTS